MADTEKPVLPPTPHPTKTRLRLGYAIAGGYIRHWHFLKPETRDRSTDALVTSRVAELVAAGLADLGAPDDNEIPTSTVSLTPAGEEWLKTYGGTE